MDGTHLKLFTYIEKRFSSFLLLTVWATESTVSPGLAQQCCDWHTFTALWEGFGFLSFLFISADLNPSMWWCKVPLCSDVQTSSCFYTLQGTSTLTAVCRAATGRQMMGDAFMEAAKLKRHNWCRSVCTTGLVWFVFYTALGATIRIFQRWCLFNVQRNLKYLWLECGKQVC